MPARIVGLLTACLLILAPATGAQQDGVGQSFDSNGVQIHYVDQGRGDPVVLLHGFTGSYARHMEAPGLMQALGRGGYRVIAMECRGHGQSGKPRDSGQYGLEMVRDVIRLLDHLNIPRAHLVGYSMGGAIATQLLVRYPDRVMTVALIGAGWEGEDLRPLDSELLTLAEGFEKRDASVLIRGVTSSGQNGPTDAEIAALNASIFARNDPQVLAAAARGLLPLYEISADSLRAIARPVLAIVGEYDARNLAATKRMAGVVRGMDVVQIPGASHATSVRPSAPQILGFFGRHRSN
jgi:pimeloyl-ACP methyl ester carboxylesterase